MTLGCGATGRAGDGAADAAGRSATAGAGAEISDTAGATGATCSATAGAGFGALGTGRPGAPGRDEALRGAAVVAPEPLAAPVPAAPFEAADVPFDAAAPLDGAAGAAGAAGNASRSLRTTGASMVDEALLTNSPNSLSLEMISLLDLPSSFASSCTRALPATALLTVRPGGKTARPRVSCTGSLLGLHGVLTTGRPAFGVFWWIRSCSGPPAAASAPDSAACPPDWFGTRKARTSVLSNATDGTRRARPNARRRSARSRHPTRGCNHAPLPGRRCRRSGISIPSTATIRSSVEAEAFSRQPTHVRCGPWPATPAEPAADADIEEIPFRHNGVGRDDIARPNPPSLPPRHTSGSPARGAVDQSRVGGTAGAASLRMSMRQPVSRAASRAF